MFLLIFVLSAAVIMIAFAKTQHIFRSFLYSACQGLAALFAVNFIGEFAGIHIAFNLFSAAVAVVGGIPGVITLLVFDILL